MAAEVAANEERLDALVNNAGIGFLPEREFSQDGVELVLQVDYLAGYLLTRELLPLLRSSAPSRIVFVASAGQAPIDFDDPMMDTGYDAGRAYCQAKLAQINQTMDMAGRLDGDVAVTALHPSTFMPTKILGPGMDPRSTVQEGIDATVRLVADPELEGVTGVYFNVQDAARAMDQAYDPDAQRRLRELSEQLVGA